MNNQYAISVPLEKQTAAENIVDKAVGYGMPGIQVDGNDILAMYDAAKEAVERARNGEGPTFIEAVTYRVSHHTSSDDWEKYRSEEEVEQWKRKDPIERFKNYLINKDIITEKESEEMWSKYDNLINELIEEADKLPLPPLKTLFTDVYDEMPWHLKEQWEEVKKYSEEK